MRTFKHVPFGFKIDNYSSLDDDTHQKVFEGWKKSGEWEDLKYHTYDQLIDLNGLMSAEYLNDYIKKYHKSMPLLVTEDDEI